MIIDVHAHLGDILNRNGGSVIGQKGIRFPHSFNFPGIFETLSMRTLGAEPLLPLLFESMTNSHIKLASDWPYGMAGPSIRTVMKACRGDKQLERRILSENACRLLGLNAAG